jgi:hypothetical protein
MSVNVPVWTIEKPITVIDYIAGLAQCITPSEVMRYSGACPESIRNDERFAKGVADRLVNIRAERRSA